MKHVLLIASLLVLPPVLAGEPSAAGAPEADVPAWLAGLLAARGVPQEDWTHLQVERHILQDGGWRVEPGSLADLVAAPSPRASAVPEAPHAVLGHLALHLMIQVGHCEGYQTEPLAEGLTKVGGSWETGLHVAYAGELPPGVDTADPAGSLTSGASHMDFSVAGVGAISIEETRITIFGSCIALLGMMTGPGVFAFDQAWPA